MTLLTFDAVIELQPSRVAGANVGSDSLQEKFQGVEFVVSDTKVSASGLQFFSQVADSQADDNTLSEIERQLGPTVAYYAPLGGRTSYEFRRALRGGVVRVLTRLVCRVLSDIEKQHYTPALHDGCRAASAYDRIVSLERDRHGQSVAKVHWSAELLKLLFGDAEEGELHFSFSLPRSVTLLPLVCGLKGSLSLGCAAPGKTYELHCLLQQVCVAQQSVHDERTAFQLAAFLFKQHLKPAEQMREIGGDSLRLGQHYEAAECYRKALTHAQEGLLLPYRRALRPPPSLEDRADDPDEDDMYNGVLPLPSAPSTLPVRTEIPPAPRKGIAPANKYFNLLLCLQPGRAAEGKTDASLYDEPLLENSRVVFPDAHVLLHVWYALHRQMIAAVSNIAHTFLLLQASRAESSNTALAPSMVGSQEVNFSPKQLQQQLVRGARWCERALSALQRMCGWCNEHDQGSESSAATERLWLETMRFKLFLRRAKLLRLTGAVENARTTLEELDEQLRLLETKVGGRPTLPGFASLLNDVRGQLAQEWKHLRLQMQQGGGLVLRF
ncbi:hypothetical protein ERJ75_001190300 [Trypanosoma vivax]|uniref:Uncharacterized protein n=1 Tax=Trypanosoma vivax (strain Y486) TaxID=1055687 RepID=G0UBY4_TRYVY|nr:hypothetical protein TRVL_06198 [Trypanosoma vivax]KAH8609499.1 hypothetical protein ERJ75_001190300 [Trypanosoma vivax]CCC53332.1 conserved hypothetical protein [Trypanosoma vivax Y486]